MLGWIGGDVKYTWWDDARQCTEGGGVRKSKAMLGNAVREGVGGDVGRSPCH